jgi:flagellar assembly protein FliH
VAAQSFRIAVPAFPAFGGPERGGDDAAPDDVANAETPNERALRELEAARAEANEVVREAQARAEAIVTRAGDEARKIVDGANGSAAEIEATASQRGFAAGEERGREAGDESVREMVQTMTQLLQSARAERAKVIESAEPELLKLATAIAERVVHAHLAVAPETVVELARNALQRLAGRETVVVRVNPRDIEILRAQRDRLLEVHDTEGLRIVADQRVDRGGVIVETEVGTIDAKISTQLREARRVLNVEDDAALPPTAQSTPLRPPAQAS